MTYKLNPFTGKLDTSDGPQGPAGVVSAAGPGSEGTPSISFAADLDTGLYNYTPNGIAVSTFGQGRLFIDSSGNVGVGTSTPVSDAVLTLSSDSDTALFFRRGSGTNQDGAIRFEGGNFQFLNGANSATVAGLSERLRITSSGQLSHIGGGSSGSPAVAFNGSAPSNSLVIDSSGRLGVGTGSATHALTVTTSGTDAVKINTADYGFIDLSNGTSTLRLQNVSSVPRVGTATNHPLVFATNEIERMRIDSNGTFRVRGAGVAGATDAVQLSGAAPSNSLTIDSSGRLGVGTGSPSSKLEIRNDVAAATSLDTTVIKLFNNLDGGSGIEFANAVAGKAKISFGVESVGTGTDDTYIGFSTCSNAGALTERVRVDSSGNVGIGTTTFPYAASGRGLLTLNGTSSSLLGFNIADVAAGYVFADSNGVSIGSPAGKNILFDINGEKARIDSAGKVGINSNPDGTGILAIKQATDATNGGLVIYATDGSGAVISRLTDGGLTFRNGGDERMRIDSSGNVGIGTTNPLYNLTVGGTNPTAAIYASNASASSVSTLLYRNADGNGNVRNVASIEGETAGNGGYGALAFHTAFNNSLLERARIDRDGRLLVGTNSARANFFNSNNTSSVQIEGTDSSRASLALVCDNTSDADGSYIALCKSASAAIGSNTPVTINEVLGAITFQGNDGSEFVEAARIKSEVDGTPGANDMPGRLVFSTTAAGASSPTERMRITNDGGIFIQKNNGDMATKGVAVEPYATVRITTDSTSADEVNLYLNRQSSDGVLLKFFQANTEEGSISVSGTTVSYNGAHLSRWSQLPSGAIREEILRGTVLSNIDEMCEWGEEDNEQLNRMKVSDVEGDPNVSGVFQAWDDDDDTYTDDFYCAMTGDFIIRIAEGVTVQRGDLLMSAGDGTAKPQDDDIIRSKTIAKVTSTHVSETYADGSYCVPCVLMAC